MPRILIPLRPILGVLQIGIKSQVSSMSDSEDSTVTYTEISSPYEDLSDIGSPGAEGPIFQDPPSPDYVPGPEEPEQAPPSPIYVPFVPEPVYPEFLPELSASSMFILIVSSFPIPSRLYIEKGMMLMLAPKSAKELLKSNLPIEQGRIKLPGSFFFGGSLFVRLPDFLRKMFYLTLISLGFPWFYGLMLLRHVVRAFWERELRERMVLYSRLLFVLGSFFCLVVVPGCQLMYIKADKSILVTTASDIPACGSVVPFLRMISHGLNCGEILGSSHPGDRLGTCVLLCGHGMWAVPLDKGLFEEIPGLITPGAWFSRDNA
ncbi:hypothetical protein Tco_0849958, partial [Tanacetum coccineum]